MNHRLRWVKLWLRPLGLWRLESVVTRVDEFDDDDDDDDDDDEEMI